MTKAFKLWFFVGLCLLSFSGCGYTTKSMLPASLKKVHVELFKNDINFIEEHSRNIYLPLLEVKTRKAIIDRFLFDGNLRISEAEDADLILKGKLISYNRGGLRYTDDDDVQEYRVQITVSLEMWHVENQENYWIEPGLVGEATYFVSGSLATTEESAINEAIIDLARRIVERTIEDW